MLQQQQIDWSEDRITAKRTEVKQYKDLSTELLIEKYSAHRKMSLTGRNSA